MLLSEIVNFIYIWNLFVLFEKYVNEGGDGLFKKM